MIRKLSTRYGVSNHRYPIYYSVYSDRFESNFLSANQIDIVILKTWKLTMKQIGTIMQSNHIILRVL
jgi:hypothetical protein